MKQHAKPVTARMALPISMQNRQRRTAPGQLNLLTLALTAALALLNTPQAQAQTDISGQTSVVWDSSNTDISVSSSGMVNASNSDPAITALGSVGTLTNSGLVTGSIGVFNDAASISLIHNSVSGTINGGWTGIKNTGTIGILNNEGSIVGGTIGIANAGDIGTLINNGVINGGSNGSGTGIVNTGIIQTVVNAGAINGGLYGVNNTGTISVLNNSGTMAQNLVGIVNGSSNSTLSSSASIHSLNNSGTIVGLGGIINNGTIGTLNNSGLIGGSGFAIYNITDSIIDTIVNSGTIQGIIFNESTLAPLNISGGSGASFGTLTGISGSIGNIISASSVIFNSGNLLLNDNISVGVLSTTGNSPSTNGIGTVTNVGSVLQVNNLITITGNYQQYAAATLAIGVGDSAVSNGVVADTGYGRLIVTGDAIVASGSSITLKKLNTYSFATGQRFVVIQASGSGTNYNAATLNYSATDYNATSYSLSGAQVYDGSYYDLVVTLADPVTGSTRPVNAATNSYAAALLNGLFNYSGTDSAMLNFYNAAVAAASSADSANRVGARLSPSATRAAAGNGVMAAANTVQGAASERTDSMRGNGGGDSGIASGENSLSPALWGRAFGGRASQGERDNISGYHASYGGVIIGGDALLAADWRIGGLFNYAHANVGDDGDNNGSSASVNSYGLMAYAGFDGKPWYINLSAGIARQQYSTTRNISFTDFDGVTNASYRGTLYTVSAQAGYPLTMATMTLTPLAGLNYSTLRQNGYTESGGNGAALNVDGSTVNSLKSQFGIKLEHGLSTSYGILQPAAQLSWNHEFKDSRLSSTASFAADSTGATRFTTAGATPLRDTAQLTLGATLLKSRNLTLSARYSVEAASGYTAQTGDVTLRWQY